MNGQLDKTHEKIKQLANAKFDKTGKLGSTLTKSVTVPILGAVSALTVFSIKSAYTADEIGDTAEKIGLSAEALQEWNHTATILGVSTERMERAFVKVNGILGDIATGNGDKYAESLALIGLSLDDLEGKNTDEAFNLIRDALSGVEDEAIRLGVANDLLSERVAADIIPVLTQEASTINDLKNEARELGIVTNEQAAQAGEFTDALDRTKQAVSSLGVDLASILLPVLQELIIKVRDNIIPTLKDWIDKWNNMDDGTKKTIVTLTGLVAATGPVLSVVGKVGPLLNMASIGLKAVGTSGIFAGVVIFENEAATCGTTSECPNIRTELCILYNGDVTPCNMFNPYVYGNINDNELDEILKGDKFNWFLKNHKSYYYCNNCACLNR
jgi:hypothetical protein